jgi:hypothetical protein
MRRESTFCGPGDETLRNDSEIENRSALTKLREMFGFLAEPLMETPDFEIFQ